jgi:hypothetical protein
MSIESTCILVKLKISFWDGFKKDKEASNKVDQVFLTEGKVGNYNKRLFAKNVFKPIREVLTTVRNEHHRMTMPWCYNGVYILPNELFFPYTETMRTCKDRLDAVVDNFILQYPVYVAAQRTKLGELFKGEDYPDPSFLRDKYKIEFNFFPVPQSEHFILDSQKDLQEQLKKTLYDTQKSALTNLYNKILELVERLHDRLNDPESVLRESLLENLDALVSVLPGLNVFDDDVLNKVYTQLREKVLMYDTQELRNDMTKRREIVAHAFDVAALLRG